MPSRPTCADRVAGQTWQAIGGRDRPRRHRRSPRDAGRLLLDDVDPLGRLAYGSVTRTPSGTDGSYDSTTVVVCGCTTRGGWAGSRSTRTSNGSVPDALTLTRRGTGGGADGRSAPLKAVLLDQHRIAGLGNMLVDEVLWRSGLAPDRPARSLTRRRGDATAPHDQRRLPAMMAAGGSHTGTISSSFRPTGARALDAAPRCAEPRSAPEPHGGVRFIRCERESSDPSWHHRRIVSTTILALSTGTTILVLVAALLLVALVMTAVADVAGPVDSS